MFYLPHWIWKLLEGRRVQILISKIDRNILDIEKVKPECQKIANYFRGDKSKKKVYFSCYWFTSLLYLANSACQLYLMNQMVYGIFTTFGPRMIQWIQFIGEENRCDPISEVFPTGMIVILL